jgi:hypothetical protein
MKKMYLIAIVASAALITNACNRVKETAKDTVNQAGNVAGQAAGEFIEGAAGGVDKVYELKVELGKDLLAAGLKTGKCKFESDTLQRGAIDNVAVIYLIFDKAVSKSVTAKAFDIKGQEMGRKMIKIQGAAGSAGYLHIPFDKETDLDTDSKVILE